MKKLKKNNTITIALSMKPRNPYASLSKMRGGSIEHGKKTSRTQRRTAKTQLRHQLRILAWSAID